MKDPNPDTQDAAILAHLKRGRSVTALSALHLFNCFRLAARVRALKDRGHRIKTDLIRTPSGKRVALYSLAS